MAREEIPMTASARDSLIAIAVLWVAFGIVVGFRLVGRFRGAGVGADDILSFFAFVSLQSLPPRLSADAKTAARL